MLRRSSWFNYVSGFFDFRLTRCKRGPYKWFQNIYWCEGDIFGLLVIISFYIEANMTYMLYSIKKK